MIVLEVLLAVLAFLVAMTIVYGQYLMLQERYEFRKKHGFDPWRHGWKTRDDEQN